MPTFGLIYVSFSHITHLDLSAKIWELGVSTSGTANLTCVGRNSTQLTAELETTWFEAQYELFMVDLTYL